MHNKECTFNDVVVTLILIVGLTISAINFYSVYAQDEIILGESFFVEKGKITGQKEIGPNKTQFNFSSNGTMNGTIEVTNTGVITGNAKGKNLVFDQEQRVISAIDGSETASYTLIAVENIFPKYGNLSFRGAAAYSTNSTGELSFLDGMFGILKGEGEIQSGDFVRTGWELPWYSLDSLNHNP
jgi:hypothetical protein